ncbi:phospholipase effector Tle1 domain-containing protein [Citrobacter farmeri]
MGRQLVIFLDGTGNRFSHKPTNVIRLLRSLPKGRENVLTYYDQGVGTFGVKETLFEWQKLPSRICGLAFGWGLKRNVRRGLSLPCKELPSGR